MLLYILRDCCFFKRFDEDEIQKGDKVEVMNDKDMPVSWRPAMVLSSRGNICSVQYDFYSGMTTDRVVESTPVDSVRPSPPKVMLEEGTESFDAGDVVEVFHDYSWKVAAILKILRVQQVGRRSMAYKQAALSGSQYLVRLLGCSLELIVDISNIRMRRTWNDNTWILMEKNFRAAGYLTATKVSNYDDTSLREPTEISLRSRKRMSPFDSSTANPNSSTRMQKLRIVEKRGIKNKVAADHIPEKVHAVAYPIWGEQNLHASNHTISVRCNQMEKAKHYNHIGISGSRSTDDSDTCSVGSCSITSGGGVNCCYTFPMIEAYAETDAICSDAESCCGSESDRDASPSPPNHQELEVSIHLLELHAYRCTLQALFVSGPLTWEQETLLTNLRMMLHISNDEHLKELKLLISTKKSPITV